MTSAHRLWLTKYHAIGSLTSGEESFFLGAGRPAWWFEEDEWSYHRFSVEKVFAMSRQAIFLVAKVRELRLFTLVEHLLIIIHGYID